MKRILLMTLFAVALGSLAAQAQGSGTATGGGQCLINGQYVFVASGGCPSSGGSGGGGGSAPAANPALYNGFYQLGYNFGRWLFGGGGSNTNAAADAAAETLRQQQQQAMMAELQRRAEEAERLHQEEEARRIAAIYNRLAATLKLNGLPHLELKTSGISTGGLQLKIGDNAQGYGIPGLPGIYTGGPGSGSGLHLKMGDSADGAGQTANQASPARRRTTVSKATASLGFPAFTRAAPAPDRHCRRLRPRPKPPGLPLRARSISTKQRRNNWLTGLTPSASCLLRNSSAR